MFWFGVILGAAGVLGKQYWLVGVGVIVMGFAVAQENQELKQRCRTGNDYACYTLEKREADQEGAYSRP